MTFPLTDSQVQSILIGERDIDEFPELYEYFMDQMPIGTAKARTGDPYEWIYQKLEEGDY